MKTDLPFAPVPLWVLELPISDRAKTLYGLLSGLRDYQTDQASYGRKLLAKKLRCSEDSLDRAKAELEKHSAISVERGEVGPGGFPRNVYTIHRIPAAIRMAAARDLAAQERGASTRTGAATNENYKNEIEITTTTNGAHEQIAFGGIDVHESPAQLVKTVAKMKVTGEEYAMAEAVLATYNAVFTPVRSFSGKEWLKDIIGRLREHPELALDEHRDVMEKMHAHPWWTDTPTPAVIYGNGKVFDRALNQEPPKDDGMDAYVKA
jgi:hypothetical protein